MQHSEVGAVSIYGIDSWEISRIVIDPEQVVPGMTLIQARGFNDGVVLKMRQIQALTDANRVKGATPPNIRSVMKGGHRGGR
jgi:hypothetical protein